MHIGIDFDNTLAGYDHLFLRVAKDWGLVPDAFVGGKKAVRDAVRRREDGERHWMRLQAEVYGVRIAEAELIDGARDFMLACRRNGVSVAVVSHKTQYAASDPNGVDLHKVSLAWMADQGFFDNVGVALPFDQVYFEPTRDSKCKRIGALGCDHFIDDLEEVFLDPAFPDGVNRILLDLGKVRPCGPFTTYPNWQAVHDAFFAAV